MEDYEREEILEDLTNNWFNKFNRDELIDIFFEYKLNEFDKALTDEELLDYEH